MLFTPEDTIPQFCFVKDEGMDMITLAGVGSLFVQPATLSPWPPGPGTETP